MKLATRYYSAEKELAASGEAVEGSTPRPKTVHGYYEVGTDLLAKPSLLADIIDMESTANFLVFCNNPSDADFIEVMLRKRGITSRKLIGNAPNFKVQSAVKEVRSGEARALVLTDVAARNVETEQFDIVVNYAMPSDPEVYLHRLGISGNGGKAGKVITILGPLDLTNFLYLKKFVDFDFQQLQAPGAELMSTRQMDRLAQSATSNPYTKEERFQTLAQSVLEHPSRDVIIAHLLHQSLDIIPSLSSRPERPERFGGEGRGEEGWGNERRGNRDDRRGRSRDFEGEEQQPRPRRNERHRSDDYEQGGEGGERRERHPRREYVPPKRNARLYIAHGKESNFTQANLEQLLASNCPPASGSVKRFSLRNTYSFIDLPEESADEVLNALRDANLESGAKFMITRATIVPEPRERQPEDEQDAQARGEDESGSADDFESRDSDSGSDQDAERSPQLAFSEDEEQ